MITMKIDTNNQSLDHAGVKIPPPFFLFSVILMMWVLDRFVYSLSWTPNPFSRIGGTMFVAIGSLLLFTSVYFFSKNKVSIEPWKPTAQLLNGGLYRFSRNPIYLGFIFIHLGIGILIQTLWMIPSGFVLYLILRYYAIAKEERYLQRRFGDDYLHYQNKIRRWF
jgi:protein-S-isoprenylcysteine O-methyltransferase Ste14